MSTDEYVGNDEAYKNVGAEVTPHPHHVNLHLPTGLVAVTHRETKYKGRGNLLIIKSLRKEP